MRTDWQIAETPPEAHATSHSLSSLQNYVDNCNIHYTGKSPRKDNGYILNIQTKKCFEEKTIYILQLNQANAEIINVRNGAATQFSIHCLYVSVQWL